MKEDWWSSYLENKFKEAADLIDKEIEETDDKDKKKELNDWRFFMEFKLNPKKVKLIIEEKLRDEHETKATYAALTKILLLEDELETAIKFIEEGLEKFRNEEVFVARKIEYLEKIGRIDDAIALIIDLNYLDSEFLSLKLAELYVQNDPENKQEAVSVLANAYLKK